VIAAHHGIGNEARRAVGIVQQAIAFNDRGVRAVREARIHHVLQLHGFNDEFGAFPVAAHCCPGKMCPMA